jgi:hypothetical protein
MYYDDGSSQQWIASNGPQVFVGTAAPAGYQGQLWFNSTNGRTYIYYDDGTTGQWVSAVGEIALTSADLPTGTVLQVVSTTKTDAYSESLADSAISSNVVTGLTATITPRSASSKILVRVSTYVSSSVNWGFGGFLIRRDSTGICVADAASSRSQLSGQAGAVGQNAGDQANLVQEFLDSPNTTSSITYGISLHNRHNGTITAYVNRSSDDGDVARIGRSTSTITLMEIAG